MIVFVLIFNAIGNQSIMAMYNVIVDAMRLIFLFYSFKIHII